MESSSPDSPHLLLLHEDDNVLVLVQPLRVGDAYTLGGETYHSTLDLGIGHKIARRNIQTGEKILKYGVPIGSAYTSIQTGDHVHLHNLRSDYLPTYTLDKDHKYAAPSH
jgi:hypothetical protein